MGPDYPTETFRVLKPNQERRYGEYRTRRVVLEAWDCLAANAVAIVRDPRGARLAERRRRSGLAVWQR